MAGNSPICAEDNDRTQTLLKAVASRCSDSLDAALSHQREDWLKGIRIPIADRLRACGALCADPIQAAELIYHEFMLQRDAGETPDWDILLGQFPEYAEPLRLFREADEIVEGADAPSGRSATLLSGYDLWEEVGRGGMGIVYRARERNLDRTVAIKRILGGALADEDAIHRFLKEARAVSRLNHPNIVQIYCVGDCDGEPFIALEFVEGSTLGERIAGTPLVPRLAGTTAAAVARAIEHAHQHGIIHRDLKPANILLSRSPDGSIPKVTDFGAAKDLEHVNQGGRTQFLGTPSYMAPEQVEPKWGAISQLTDVYGIGAILYESLTGRPPFRADSIGETLRQVVESQPVSPRLLNPAVPRDLETVCLKCLQKEPGNRYESAAALGEDLERFLAGEPIHARPIGPAARGWMWCRRKPGTASLVAVLLLSLMGGMAGITLQWRKAEAARKSALASDMEAQELVSELIQSIPLVPGRGYQPVAPNIDSLLKAEAHCNNLLQKNPDDIPLRIALTKVYGSLETYYAQRGQVGASDATVRQARELWEPLPSEIPSNPVCRDWLATTYSWQRGDDVLQFLQSIQQAEAIWQKLADEQPGNLDFMQKIWGCRVRMTGLLAAQVVRDNCLRPLEESRAELERLIRQNAADRPLRKRLAFTCFLLGEIYASTPSTDTAISYWRESYQHYATLAEKRSDDLLGNISLAISCSRLIQEQPTDPYYVRAVPLLELREARRPAAALRFARQAAALSSQLAVYPAHDPGFLYDLGERLKDSSALANQLGEPALSLQQAELGRSTVEELNRIAPDSFLHEDALGTAWERIAKARWSLGSRDQALAAFREATAIEKRLFEREPSNHSFRASLTKFYDRLVYFGSQAGDLRGAADAILARLKLWPDDRERLAQASNDFAALAERVTTRGRLSREDQAERDRYLSESRRLRHAADAAPRRAGDDMRVQR